MKLGRNRQQRLLGSRFTETWICSAKRKTCSSMSPTYTAHIGEQRGEINEERVGRKNVRILVNGREWINEMKGGV